MNQMRPPGRPATPAGARSPLAELDLRSREIFRRIVEAYLESGEPVGSRNLSRSLSVSLSPASVRNVMSDLEGLGLIYAPHTSAGRLPTELGLRFFVDALLEIGDLGETERSQIETRVRAHAHDGSPEAVLAEAGNLLSGLSRGAGVVLASKADPRVKHIDFVRLEPRRVLAILVGDDGSVENRILALDEDIPPSALVEAANYLNARLQGRTLNDLKADMERSRKALEAELDVLSRRVVEAGLATWAGSGSERPQTLIVRGQANLLENLHALEDLERIRLLFEDLEKQNDIIELLGHAESGDGVRIFIGSENKLFSLSGSTVVATPYRDANRKIVGVLGVIGPTRLNYARIVPVVENTARVVGRLIDRD